MRIFNNILNLKKLKATVCFSTLLLLGPDLSVFCAEFEEHKLLNAESDARIEIQQIDQSDNFPRPLRQQKSDLPARIKKEQNEQLARKQDEVLPELPGFEKKATQDFIKLYTKKRNLDWIASSLKTGEPYLAFIRDEIQERGLPEELLYLPLIESAYVNTARSKSGARGMWQFMANSIRPYMKITDWLDERLDFWKSTNAALSKLQSHFNQFGNWELALAAYNSGAGAISKITKSTGINDYWVLSESNKLKRESISYVPKLLALYYIISNPRKFGLDCLPLKEYVWVKVKPEKQINLSMLAEYAGVNAAFLRKSNSELLFNVTPPDASYELKILKEDEDAINGVLNNGELKLLKYHIYKIQSGDTLSALSQHYGVSVEDIISNNQNLKPKLLKPGDLISIPAYKDVAPYKGRAETAQANANKAGAAKTGAKTAAGSKEYVAQKGDTFWSLSRRFNVSLESLYAANNLSEGAVLSIGKTLIIP